MTTPLTFHALTPERLGDYLDFFDHRAFTDNPRWARCYCNFPLHDHTLVDGNKLTRDENRAAVIDRIGKREARGVLAYSGDEVVGWCNAGPWKQFPMLREVGEQEPDTTGAIMCFIVAPGWRGKGVASGLLAAACAGLREQGMRVVRARTVRSEDAARNHFGPLRMYLAAGFDVVGEVEPDTVLVRKSLA